MHKEFIFLVYFFSCSFAFAQTYEPGESYFGSNDYIEYKAGNLPIIITAPHGGSLEPNEIPNRNCTGCVYVKDSFTEELIRQIYDAIFESFGCYPHVVINRLHRRKLDANRDVGDAADGNAMAEQAWEDFHSFIQSAKDTITTKYEKGLYLDLHGHGHEIQRLELGYRITKTELQLPDPTLNQAIYVNDVSIKNLVSNNLMILELSDLLRGADSFGEFYEEENYPAVPSQTDPFPLDNESYFSGGYNTERHGSKLGGSIDGIQIECNMEGVRNTFSNRENFAAATARVLKSYLEVHYFDHDFLTSNCQLTTSTKLITKSSLPLSLFPNPVNDLLTINIIENTQRPIFITIQNSLGDQIYSNTNFTNAPIQLKVHLFPEGVYYLKIESSNVSTISKFIKLR